MTDLITFHLNTSNLQSNNELEVSSSNNVLSLQNPSFLQQSFPNFSLNDEYFLADSIFVSVMDELLTEEAFEYHHGIKVSGITLDFIYNIPKINIADFNDEKGENGKSVSILLLVPLD
jgi:hypothetical protein